MLRSLLAVLAVLFVTSLSRAGGPDHGTPRKTAEAFGAAMRAGDGARAADCLDLRDLPADHRAQEGPVLARQLERVLQKVAPLRPERLSDDPAGDPMDGPGSDVVGGVPVGDETVTVSLTRVKLDTGASEWKFSRATVAAIPSMYAAHGEPSWAAWLPTMVARHQLAGHLGWQWLGLLGSALGALALAQLFVRVAGAGVRRAAASWGSSWTGGLVDASKGLRLLLACALFRWAYPALALSQRASGVLDTITLTLFIFAVAAFVIRALNVSAEAYEARLPDDTFGEQQTRGVRTQIAVARKIASIVVAFLAGAVVLLQFQVVRNLGMSLLASAGVMGVIVGVAAQRSLGSMIAGLQLSITQPIRIGDLVVMEGETGVVEDITLTFVAVRLLDERRLIVPLTRVIEQPFQNWTKPGPQLLVTVQLLVDLSTPVALVRDALTRIVEEHAAWDERVVSLQVVDSTDRALVLKATMSVASAADSFAFKADVRERLIAFLQAEEGGRYLFAPKPAAPAA
ncbi:MAG: mechanosensitive ion channel [Polyangiaceae bacterium]|nr:mechanosensitive ion channel [Polyangiaceae bacterium]